METKKKTYVWSSVTRLFHWGLVAAVITTFLSAEFENALLIHISAGATMGILLGLRIIWGFTGPKYSRFKNFNFNLKDLSYYFINFFKDRRSFVGHNPAASWVTMFLIIVAFFTVFSGWVLLGAQEVRGLFSFLGGNEEYISRAKTCHIITKNIILIVALIHIVGATFEHFWHKTHIINSMITGFKDTSIDIPSIEPTKAQNRLGITFLILAFITGIGVWKWSESPLIGAHKNLIYYPDDFPVFYKECTECHSLMPPVLLPQKSWEVVLSDPKDHFRDDISQKVKHLETIKGYIYANSAETSQSEASRGIIESIKGKNIYRITRTKYWKNIHEQIPQQAFKNPLIKSKSNCGACHNEIGITNYVDDEDISLKAFGWIDSIKIYLKLNK